MLVARPKRGEIGGSRRHRSCRRACTQMTYRVKPHRQENIRQQSLANRAAKQSREVQLTTAENGANLLKQEHCSIGLYKPLQNSAVNEKGNGLSENGVGNAHAQTPPLYRRKRGRRRCTVRGGFICGAIPAIELQQV